MRFVGVEGYALRPAEALPYGALEAPRDRPSPRTAPQASLPRRARGGLNQTEKGAMRELIRDIAERGVTVVLVEHDMNWSWACRTISSCWITVQSCRGHGGRSPCESAVVEATGRGSVPER